MKTLILTLLLALPALAQSKPDIAQVATVTDHGETFAFFVDKNASLNGSAVTFTGLMQRIKDEHLDPAWKMFTVFRADCDTYAFAYVTSTAYFSGVKLGPKDHDPNTQIAEKGTPIREAIRVVCTAKRGMIV